MRRSGPRKGLAGRSERGFFLVLCSISLLVLIGFAGLAVDLGKWYLAISRLQNATDAAALAGAVYLPGNVDQAVASADRALNENKVSEFTKSSAERRPAKDLPSHMFVRASTSVSTEFIHLLGIKRNWEFTRSSTAVWRSGINPGKWSNVLGTEPTTYPAWAPPEKRLESRYWALISGGLEDKAEGPRYTASICSSGSVSGCRGSTNLEYADDEDPRYTQPEDYVVFVPPGLSGSTVSIEVYDPAFVQTGANCEYENVRRLFQGTGDPTYDPRNADLCTGEYSESSRDEPFVETNFSFEDANQNPIGVCPDRTFPGWGVPRDNEFGVDLLAAYHNDPVFREVFRKWNRLCTVPYDAEKGLELHVRVKGTRNSIGINSFGVRAAVFQGGTLMGADTQRQVLVYALKHVQVASNSASGTSAVPVGLVPSSYAGQTISLSVFDLGDAEKPARLDLGSESIRTNGGSPVGQCEFTPPGRGSYEPMANCASSVSYPLWNGKEVSIRWHVPDDYYCDETQLTPGLSCALFVRMSYPAGAEVFDNWTATAQANGAPVRLVRNVE